jgi:hypothetical protein
MLPLCAYLSRYESCPTRKRIFAHESEGRERDGAYLGRKRNKVLANWSQGNNPGVPPPPSSSGTCSCRTTCSAPSRSPRYATEYSRRRIQTMPSPAPCPAAAEHAPCHRWPPRPSAVVARAPLFLRRSRRDERSGRRLGAGVWRRRRERERRHRLRYFHESRSRFHRGTWARRGRRMQNGRGDYAGSLAETPTPHAHGPNRHGVIQISKK